MAHGDLAARSGSVAVMARSGRRGVVTSGVLVASVALVACVDLFHSTDFGGCAGGGCVEGGSTSGDASARDSGRDATHDTSHDGSLPKGDAVAEARADGRRKDSGSEASTAPGDSGADSPLGKMDAGHDSGMDAGTDFCAWSESTAAANAEHACLWLSGCFAAYGLSEYGTCYPTALLAYDCALDPNQKVRGSLHAFWDALRSAESCDAVLQAMFPAAVPGCTMNSTHQCIGNILVACGSNAKIVSAANCETVGYTCSNGTCQPPGGAIGCGATVAQSPTPTCDGGVFHSCQEVERNGGAVVVDIGKSCTNFGAGRCMAVPDAAAGCLPSGTTMPCTPSTTVTCGADASVTGCATGMLETVHCGSFGPAACGLDGGHAASAQALSEACYSGVNPGAQGCGGRGFTDNAGPSGPVSVNCPDASTGCMQSGSFPYCTGLPSH